MQEIHGFATLTAKGQLTLPKPIRQALGVTEGDRVRFELDADGRVSVSGDSAAHTDPVIGQFLTLLAQDIAANRHVGDLPPELQGAMLARLGAEVNIDEEIDGDVAI